MTEQLITIMPLAASEVSAVAELIIDQDIRHYALDSRLRTVRSRHRVERDLAELCAGHERPLVALDRQGHVRGYARPSVWEVKETSLLRAFLTARNGIVQNLTLPAPTDDDANAVGMALLAALSDFWHRNNTSGSLIRWPNCAAWIEPLLSTQEFLLDSLCALHPPLPFTHTKKAVSTQIQIRQARPADEDILVALLQEELLFHEQYTPFVRASPEVLLAFRAKLAHLWAGGSLQEGAPLVLVAEQEGEIVAMVETTLLVLGLDDEPGFTKPGSYGCIDNVSVRKVLRGQGVGQRIIQVAFDAFDAQQIALDGWILWYNPGNPKAVRFWSYMRFVSLWTTYQRLSSRVKKE